MGRRWDLGSAIGQPSRERAGAMPRTAARSGGNLPVERTSFVGRRRELGEIRRLLGESRLVTLTGVGGTGKTRLALQVTAQLRRAFQDGVWFVDLTSLRAPELPVLDVQDPNVLAYPVMVALGMREQPGAGSATAQLVRYLAGRQALLMLDNCEHLLPVCAGLAESLLRGCPRLRILATTREPLSVPGEVLLTVPPLPTPDPGRPISLAELDGVESVTLFVDRVRAFLPGFTVSEDNAGAVAQLCRRVDGLPLAIELAAARMRALTPTQILDRLTERFALLSRGRRTDPERKQTLRGCIEWSFDLCSKPECILWTRLSTFTGGFELDAVEGVCADERLPAGDLLDLVTGLVDKSVLISEHPSEHVRYRMLETILDYGQDKLRASGEQPQLRGRHRDWYVLLTAEAEAEWISPRQAHWLARVDRELPNLRAAFEYNLTDPDGGEVALATASNLLLYWTIRGLQSEGRSWLNQALALSTGATMTRVKALYASAALASVQADLAAAAGYARQGYDLAAQLGDARAHAIAALADALPTMYRGDLAGAARRWQTALHELADQQTADYLIWRIRALTGVAMTESMLGDFETAARCHEEILAICRPRGELWFSGFALWNLGLGLFKQGDSTGAATRMREGLTCLRSVNDTFASAFCLDALAWIALDEGNPERAATLVGAATQIAHAMGTRPDVFPELSARHEQYEQRTRAVLGEWAYQAAFTRGERMPLDEAVAYALEEAHAPEPPSGEKTAPAPASPLTRREWQVAELLAQGLSNRDIAERLVIAQRTAEGHVENILAKLGATSRSQVAAWMAAQRSDHTDS